MEENSKLKYKLIIVLVLIIGVIFYLKSGTKEEDIDTSLSQSEIDRIEDVISKTPRSLTEEERSRIEKVINNKIK